VEYDPSKAVQAYNDYPKGGTPRQNVGVMGYHCPAWGNQNTGMEPNSLDLDRRMAYAIVNEDCTSSGSISQVKEPAKTDWAKFFDSFAGGTSGPQPCCFTGSDIHRGYAIVGMNIDTGAKTKLGDFPERTGNQSGVLGTAAGLLMTAWENGDVSIYDKDNGKLLWNFNTGTNMAAAGITYAVNGKQYFAILGGGGPGNVSTIPDEDNALGGNPNLWVFGLR
jgi:DNA-binding beta-propeller fold protein YncE